MGNNNLNINNDKIEILLSRTESTKTKTPSQPPITKISYIISPMASIAHYVLEPKEENKDCNLVSIVLEKDSGKVLDIRLK